MAAVAQQAAGASLARALLLMLGALAGCGGAPPVRPLADKPPTLIIEVRVLVDGEVLEARIIDTRIEADAAAVIKDCIDGACPVQPEGIGPKRDAGEGAADGDE